MTIPFDLLPVELQQSVRELREAGVPESTIAALIDRTLTALATKANRVQVEVWEMESRLGDQLSKIGNKLQSDIQTQLGATNEMLIEVRSAQLTAHPQIEEARQGIAELKKNWSELERWRSRVEAALASFSESRDESKEERAQIRDEVKHLNDRHGQQLGALLARMGASEADRKELHQQLDEINQAFAQIALRLRAIEGLLEVAGNHEAGG